MPRTRLTDLLIKTAKPENNQAQSDFWDSTVVGLSVRVTQVGTKTFSFKYRGKDGKERRLKLGRYPELTLAAARAMAMDSKSRLIRGEKFIPGRDSKKGNSTVSDLIAEFVKRHASFNRSGGETERVLRREFEGGFGGRDYTLITKGEIIQTIEAIADRGAPAQARNTLAALRKMFNWAVSRDLIEHSPCDRVKPPEKASRRERVLTLSEIQLVWKATDKLNWPFREIVKLLILTGQRRMEIGNLRWLWIDSNGKTFNFPAEAMKNSREHILPLSDLAWSVVETTPKFAGEDRLFPSRNSNSEKSASGFSKAKRQLDQETGIQDWVFHDIRRTVATQMNAIGVRDTTVDRVLSHTISGVSGVYNKHQYIEEKREALQRWAARLSTV